MGQNLKAVAVEQVMTVPQLAGILQVSPRTLHGWLRDDHRVLKLGPRGRKGKRDHVTLRVPVSVVAELVEEWKRQ